MGTDALVNCDCYQRGLLRTPPPNPELVYIDEESFVSTHATTQAQRDAFFDWSLEACVHGDFCLIHERIGNSGLVGLINHFLSQREDCYQAMLKFAVPREKPVANYPLGEDLLALRHEARKLRELILDGGIPMMSRWRRLQIRLRRIGGMWEPTDAEMRSFLLTFADQIEDLTDAALATGNPIVFSS